MERERALEIWDAIYGKNNKWQVDCFGAWMYRDDYGDTEKKRVRPGGDGKQYKYGWEIDHIRPKSDFESESNSNFLNNYEPMHFDNNRNKSDAFPHFKINNRTYRIVKCDICSSNGYRGYGIINESNERIDWKGKQGRYFRSNK